MQRTHYLAAVLIAAFIALAAVVIATSGDPADAQPVDTRPNIVFFVTDDLDTNLMSQMPAFESNLQDDAVTFTRSYVADPLCCPSRASILTGQFAHNHGIYNNAGQNGGAEAFEAKGLEDETIAYALQESGYTTSLVGKFLNNKDSTRIPAGWDDWHGWVGDFFDGSYRVNNNGVIDTCRPSDCHNTDYLAARGKAFIENEAGEGEPFFLYFSTNAPHDPDPEFVAPRYKNEVPNLVLKKTPAFAENDVSDKPQWVRSKQLNFSDAYVAKLDENQRNYVRSMLSVRDAYNDLVATLKATGEYDNTVIVFTSDHGKFKGDHGLGVGKRSPYLHDIRVPTYIEAGSQVGDVPHTEGRIVSNVDYYATFADLAGLPSAQTDGRSLVPLIKNESVVGGWRVRTFVEGYAEASANGPFPIPSFTETVTPTTTYTKYETNEIERYNIESDRWQLDNLGRAGDDATRRLNEIIVAFKRCEGQTCRDADTLP